MGKYYWPSNKDEQEISVGDLFAFKKLSFRDSAIWCAGTPHSGPLVSSYGRNIIAWPTDTHSIEAECLAERNPTLCSCAQCRRAAEPVWPHNEPAPHVPCSCGVYSTKNHRHWPGEILCIVQISGRVVEGTLGYRSERATLKTFLHYSRKYYDGSPQHDPYNIAQRHRERLRVVADAYKLPIMWEWPQNTTAEHLMNIITQTQERAS